MLEHNSRVIDTLNRYINDGPEPHYAIMLNGAWGCGKTYFIKEKWMKQISNKEKFSIINVSLFGLKTIDELKEEIAHNKIIFEEAIERSDKADKALEKGKELAESNVIKGIGSLANKIIESKIGIGFDDMSKIFTRDWLSEDKEGITKVLILDDLERAKMDLKEIFGFISSYVESTGLRVIFLSNDDEIKKTEKSKIDEDIKVEDVIYEDIEGKDNISKYNNNKLNPNIKKITTNKKTIEIQRAINNDEDYRRVREKVIGETLRIEADIDDALSHFFDQMEYATAEKQLIEPIMREVRLTLGYKNLRVVRHTLMKLQPLLRIIITAESYASYPHQHIEISGKIKPKEEYIKIVTKFFMIANMKKIMGDLESKNLWVVGIGEGFALYKPLTQLDDEHNIWVNYIWGGELDEKIIRRAVEEDMNTFVPQDIVEKDSIYKLQVGYWEYTKEEFYELQTKMIDELRQGVYTQIRAIMQGYCLLITFEKYGILEGVEDVDVFFNEVLQKVTLSDTDGDKSGYRSVDYIRVDFGGYRGYQLYYSVDKPRVVKFLEKVKNAYKDSKKDSILKKMDTLLTEIINGNKQAYHLFDYIEQNNQPVLDRIGADKLWKVLDMTPLIEQRGFFDTLMSRYGLNSTGAEDSYLVYKPEGYILESLVEGYSQRYDDAKKDRDNKVSMYNYLKGDAEKTLEGFKKKMEKGEEVKI